ncbi:IclR family transcriptional regulator [Paraburkholderia sp. EG286B]|uniref:IclR family transcriptional regulator n=1 Tax=Paraburkholderia sp. EG286B TaxID=3237011 RepID=UPI0034D35A62
MVTHATIPSTRQQTNDTGRYVRSTPGNQSLTRGLEVLRAFMLTPLLTNAEIAERTGLPRPTVSRLVHALVDSGFLLYDIGCKAYRLGPVHLSLAKTFHSDLQLIKLAEPLLRRYSEQAGINAGLAVPDQQDMMYLTTIRNEKSGMIRQATWGSRMPMETSSAGAAYLASLPADEQRKIVDTLIPAHCTNAQARSARLYEGIAHVARHGFSIGEWQPDNIGLSVPLMGRSGTVYCSTVSFMVNEATRGELIAKHSTIALSLAEDIRLAWKNASRY